MCGLRTGQNHVRSAAVGWIDESGIKGRRPKPDARLSIKNGHCFLSLRIVAKLDLLKGISLRGRKSRMA